MGRIHRYGQTKDCLIFNFVATNTIEGRVLQRLLEKLQEIRDALDDDAVFNVVGEVLPAAARRAGAPRLLCRATWATPTSRIDCFETSMRNSSEPSARMHLRVLRAKG